MISKGCKPNKIQVDQGGEFYNNLFKRFLKINNIEMYSTYNEGKSVVAERFIRTLKNKIFKQMTAIQQNIQEKFRIEKVLKRKGDKLYVKWKGYDNSFNGWIDKKDLE